jgi:diguanylate cyclase (GGDEF)-like protein
VSSTTAATPVLDLPTAPPSAQPSAEALRPAVLTCVETADLPIAGRWIRQLGLEVQSVTGWSEALSLFRELQPAAVLLDSSFLEGAGVQLCAALRRTSGRIETPVLALCRNRREVARALEAGASDVVDKPLDWAVVSRRLDVMVRAFLASQEVERQRRRVVEAHRLVAEARRRFDLERLTDSLTGLPNRVHFEQVLHRALRRTGPGKGSLALMIVDVDRFTGLNEALGRRAGDEILRVAARRLKDCLRSRSGGGAVPGVMALARLGGDEFAVMTIEATGRDRSAEFADAVRAALGARMEVGDTPVYLSVSIGVAIASEADAEADLLLQHADTALVAAKATGGGGLRHYSEALGGETETKLEIDRRLRDALEKGELRLHYQPLVQPANRRLVGVEALLRWNDPERGPVAPADFIPIAEDTGLILPIGTWVLETACRQLRAWLDEGLPPLRMAVNVSRCQLERGDFAAEVQRVLGETGLDPALLELELSERGALRADPAVVAQLRRLKALGVRLVVDDFGTGESAIAHLQRFPLDGLKIDRSFVQGLTDGEASFTITSAVAAMAHRMKLTVVAEGVETEAELARVNDCGCEMVQGFLFARPVAADELRSRLKVGEGVVELLGAVA